MATNGGKVGPSGHSGTCLEAHNLSADRHARLLTGLVCPQLPQAASQGFLTAQQQPQQLPPMVLPPPPQQGPGTGFTSTPAGLGALPFAPAAAVQQPGFLLAQQPHQVADGRAGASSSSDIERGRGSSDWGRGGGRGRGRKPGLPVISRHSQVHLSLTRLLLDVWLCVKLAFTQQGPLEPSAAGAEGADLPLTAPSGFPKGPSPSSDSFLNVQSRAGHNTTRPTFEQHVERAPLSCRRPGEQPKPAHLVPCRWHFTAKVSLGPVQPPPDGAGGRRLPAGHCCRQKLNRLLFAGLQKWGPVPLQPQS